MLKRVVNCAISLALTASVFCMSTMALQPISTTQSYDNTESLYIQEHGEIKGGNNIIKTSITSAKLIGGASLGSYGGKENIVLLEGADTGISIPVSVNEEGYYKIDVLYTGIIESDKTIKLSLAIDGCEPFFEAGSLELPRCYVNETNDFKTDSLGNDIRPIQIQSIYWQKTSLYKNDVGTVEPYMFYFTVGEHTVDITAANGGVCLAEISLSQKSELISYSEYSDKYSDKSSSKLDDDKKLQGEKADYKSDICLYPMTDRTNCATEPFSEMCTKLNTIGGSNWSNPGQWIEWKFNVETAGLYKIDLRVRQNANQGMKCYRTISINGEIPFAELENYGFAYNRSWYIETLTDPTTGEPFEFYFEPGEYTIRMEATTGDMCEPLEAVNDILTELNDLYHNIIMITGTSPDIYRDYNLEKSIPGLVDTMIDLADRLDKQMENIKQITGGSGTQAVSLTTLADQLRLLAEKPKTISDRVSNFYSNISAVSAWANSAFQQPLEIDYLRIGCADSAQLKANANIFKSIGSVVKSFIASFMVDYNSIGDSDEEPDIVVWTTAGREQAEALKQLIDRDFSSNRDVGVSLKLVQTGLVEAVVAGTGPDVALSIGMNQPVDFASRKILEPLDTYEGFDEMVSENFYESAMIPFQYRDHTYALPLTQDFNVMFYRTDVLSQLGLSIPDTWTELEDMMAILARNNMQVGIPALTSTSAGVINTAFPQTILTMFMQNDVELYSEDLRKTNLNSSQAIAAFTRLTNFYTEFGLPTYFDAANRFRTGEMPIIIASLATYNTLSISAPEIAGRWGMARIPGTLREDGTINRADEFTATACVMFKTASNKDACWEFLKWYVSEQTQYDYGMELEAVLGVSGRYLTANKLAFERLPWDSDTADVIRSQWQEVSTVPQVPGYYFVSRYLTNAISDTVVNGENARVVLGRYSDTIDAELERKNNQLDMLWNKQ